VSGSETSTFDFRDDPRSIFLDAVSVAAIPEPASIALLGTPDCDALITGLSHKSCLKRPSTRSCRCSAPILASGHPASCTELIWSAGRLCAASRRAAARRSLAPPSWSPAHIAPPRPHPESRAAREV
jgi:hypothetical protein